MISMEIKNDILMSIDNLNQVAVSIRQEIAKPILTQSLLSEAALDKQALSCKANGRNPTSNNDLQIKIGLGVLGVILVGIGLVSRKNGWFVGGASALGADLVYHLSKSGTTVLSSKSSDRNENKSGVGIARYDYSVLSDKLFKSASDRVKRLTSKWNHTVEENHSRLNAAILNSSIDEVEKSNLLAKAAEEVTFNVSMTDFLVKIGELGKEENLEGIKTFLKEFTESLEKKFDSSFSKQIEVYNSIASSDTI